MHLPSCLPGIYAVQVFAQEKTIFMYFWKKNSLFRKDGIKMSLLFCLHRQALPFGSDFNSLYLTSFSNTFLMLSRGLAEFDSVTLLSGWR